MFYLFAFGLLLVVLVLLLLFDTGRELTMFGLYDDDGLLFGFELLNEAITVDTFISI